MSERIEVGDLCAIVKVCCEAQGARVKSFIVTVESIQAQAGRCSECKRFHDTQTWAIITPGRADDGRDYWPIAWLKKIPPLTEDEMQRELRDEVLEVMLSGTHDAYNYE